MYINTFKYTPKDVSCQLCTEYVKKLGCTALRCPWLAERIEAGVVGYREAVLETFPHERRLFQRLNLLIKHYPGSLWSSEQHERRMQYQCAVQGYRRRRDTNAYYAAMYLLTSNDDIYRRTANCFCKDRIEFGYRQSPYSQSCDLELHRTQPDPEIQKLLGQQPRRAAAQRYHLHRERLLHRGESEAPRQELQQVAGRQKEALPPGANLRGH